MKYVVYVIVPDICISLNFEWDYFPLDAEGHITFTGETLDSKKKSQNCGGPLSIQLLKEVCTPLPPTFYCGSLGYMMTPPPLKDGQASKDLTRHPNARRWNIHRSIGVHDYILSVFNFHPLLLLTCISWKGHHNFLSKIMKRVLLWQCCILYCNCCKCMIVTNNWQQTYI